MDTLTFVTLFITFSKVIAKFCNEGYEVTFGCDITYGNVINTLNTVRSVTECASWCRRDTRCLTVKYDDTNTICYLNSERYLALNMNCQRMVKFVRLIKSSCRKFVNADCTLSNECTVANSRCVLNKCQCDPGYSYNKNNESCITACDVYGSTYTGHPYYSHNGLDQRVIKEVDRGDCERACTNEINFLCRSFDFISRFKNCYLTNTTAFLDQGDYRLNDKAVYYDRNCQ